MALKGFSETVHFTHYIVAHAHLGAYAFVTNMDDLLIGIGEALRRQCGQRLAAVELLEEVSTEGLGTALLDGHSHAAHE